MSTSRAPKTNSSPRTNAPGESPGRKGGAAATLAADFSELCSILASISDPALTEQILRELLTRAELNEVAGRWKLVKLLDSGMSQRRVAEQLGMSLCKITRGSRELKKPNSALKSIIKHNIQRSEA